jgi:S-adenosylmethionine decarboxylase
MEKISAKIVDHIKSDKMDAYLLTESSLFVQDSRVVLITCGTTLLLNSLGLLTEKVKELGRTIEWVGYSRKNFAYPWIQQAPHSSISEEYNALHAHFPEGQPFLLGPLDADHYFVFINDNIERPRVEAETDQQLNINMYDLDPEVAKNFFFPAMSINGPVTAELREKTGLADVMSGFEVQDMAFEPCGYSLNAVQGSGHYSIHVTPEAHCSYASFEATTQVTSYRDLIQKVLNVFRPRRFTTIVLLDENAPGSASRKSGQDIGVETIAGYETTVLSELFVRGVRLYALAGLYR